MIFIKHRQQREEREATHREHKIGNEN